MEGSTSIGSTASLTDIVRSGTNSMSRRAKVTTGLSLAVPAALIGSGMYTGTHMDDELAFGVSLLCGIVGLAAGAGIAGHPENNITDQEKFDMTVSAGVLGFGVPYLVMRGLYELGVNLSQYIR
jgi:hypothetical protein